MVTINRWVGNNVSGGIGGGMKNGKSNNVAESSKRINIKYGENQNIR